MSRRVVLDACVIYPALLRDLLLRCAEGGLFEPIWTPRILDEVRRALERRVGEGDPRAARAVAAMCTAFPQASHSGPVLCGTVGLPDRDDEHVVSAARSTRADAIVTLNVRHFPLEILSTHDMQVLTPDEFLLELWRADSASVEAEVRLMSLASKNPHMSQSEILDAIRSVAPQFVDRIESECRESPHRYAPCVARCA